MKKRPRAMRSCTVEKRRNLSRRGGGLIGCFDCSLWFIQFYKVMMSKRKAAKMTLKARDVVKYLIAMR